MEKILSLALFSSQNILEHYAEGLDISSKELERFVFIEAHHKDTYKPDYIFKNTIKDFMRDKSRNEMILDSLSELSSMLEFRSHNIYVKNNQFEKWQNTIISISPLLIISNAIYQATKSSIRIDKKSLTKHIFDKTAIPSIYEPSLDMLIEELGLSEMHMHLNGTSEIDIVWQDALRKPTSFYTYIKKSFHDKTVTEQYFQVGKFRQEDIYRLLKLASTLKETMFNYLNAENQPSKDRKYFKLSGLDLFSVNNTSKKYPCTMQGESLFFVDCFEYLQSHKNSNYFGYLFHYYTLIYSYFQKLMVQQKEQVGFDQFQKITNNEIREFSEEHYQSRYKQVQGMYNQSLSTLEGRFAPKMNIQKSYKLLKAIEKDYKKNQNFTLKLVPHFIKLPDTRRTQDIITFRDLEVRQRNNIMLDVLLDTMKIQDKEGKSIFKELIVGFDVAANELHASPEAFSPTFRKLKFLGYSNFTYHAGEDFIHLLSGMRMIYEAVDFLEMRSGNRIGHATALGLEPALWEQRLYESQLTIKKGEWLDNLIFVYHLYVDNQTMSDSVAKIEHHIRRYFSEIYGHKVYYNLYQMIAAWKCRKYDPFIVFEWRAPSIFEEFDKNEKQCIADIKLRDEQIFSLFESYHDSKTIEKYNEMIQIGPLELFDANELRNIQNIMLNYLNEKNIAIETLPTSNVRISYYKSYEEHHISRWLGLSHPEDPLPAVVVGSDDTGIFMTNLRNEYAHIYQVLKKKTDAQTAINKIRNLIENSKAYTFK